MACCPIDTIQPQKKQRERERVCVLIKWAGETAWKFNRLMAHVSKLCPSFGFAKGQEMDDGETVKMPMVWP